MQKLICNECGSDEEVRHVEVQTYMAEGPLRRDTRVKGDLCVKCVRIVGFMLDTREQGLVVDAERR